MIVDLVIRSLNSLWKFVLANPEISIFVAGIVGTSAAWLFRACFRLWKRRKTSLIVKHRVVIPPSLPSTWFVNVGESQGHLLWEDCVRYECISAGGGQRYRDALQKLMPGDTVYAYVIGSGYVGYGQVVEDAVPARAFITGGIPLLEQGLVTTGFEEDKDEDNLEISDWIVRMQWLKTYTREQARFFSGAFVHRGTMCKLSHEETLDFLHKEFDV